MKWEEIRNHYPRQWLVVEAVEAHSTAGKRSLDELGVLGVFPDSAQALRRYVQLHHKSPERELYVLHTDRVEVVFEERHWLGLMNIHSAGSLP